MPISQVNNIRDRDLKISCIYKHKLQRQKYSTPEYTLLSVIALVTFPIVLKKIDQAMVNISPI